MEDMVKISIRCSKKLKKEASKKLKESQYLTISNFVRMQLHDFVYKGEKNGK